MKKNMKYCNHDSAAFEPEIIKKYKKQKTPTNVKSILIAYIKRKLIKKLKSL